jgi:amino acid transporter/nucleotide-binding universal stress UspA family protein
VPKDLERDLGLYAVLTISIGAMIGSGIFVLPGLASKIAGPAVILAYLLAGLLVLPAALSKAEMATAMPESGGTYLYIDRAMGPLMGTIAGIGAWFSLVFKSAFALVGLGAYLLLFVSIDPRPVALGLAVLIVGVNVVGVKQTGRLQAIIVSVVLAVLLLFVADGITYVDSSRYHAFFPNGHGSVLAAAGFVFVSYAGVTKIASVAEEVENPGRNIPIGMLLSVVVMMGVYTLVVFVVVGIADAEALQGSLTPMAVGAAQLFDGVGELVIAVVAVLALTSMANAGVLSSSRYPLALSRDELAPATFSRVSERFRTPVTAIGLTGLVLVGLIAFVPVLQLAKLASAFKILIFSLTNVALIAFRESDLQSYDPEFVAPGYPWVQLLGILGGLVLLTQMGTLSMVGAAGIVVSGLLWYRIYGRERTEREGAAIEGLRRGSADRALDRTRDACTSVDDHHVLIPFGHYPTPEQRQQFLALVHLAADLVRRHGGQIQVVRFEEVPEQLDLTTARRERTLEGVRFEEDSGELVGDLGVPIEVGEIVTHDTKRAVANFVDHYEVDLVLGEWHPSRWRGELVGADVDWYMNHASSDFVFVRNRGYDDVSRIVVIADRGPFDPLEIIAADGVAMANDATVEFVSTLEPSATDEQHSTARAYLDDLAAFCRAETECTVLTTTDQVDTLVDAAADADLAIVGTSAQHVVFDVLFGSLQDRLVGRLDCTVVLTHSWSPRRHTFLRAILERLIY